MQVTRCQVRLSGNLNSVVTKKDVTVAEIVVLRALHGSDSVVNINPTGQDKRPHQSELSRLREEYGVKVVTAVFPGANPNLPITLADIGIESASADSDDSDDGKAGAKAGGNKASAKA